MITIVPERNQDMAAIHQINRAAFGQEGEAVLVDRLRKGAPPFISLVALDGDEVVGHILFTQVTLQQGMQNHPAKLLGLAPMAVSPGRQGQGIGALLVQQGLAVCRNQGFEAAFVLGHPGFYPKFGFQVAGPKGFECEFPSPEEAFMFQELKQGALQEVGASFASVQNLNKYRGTKAMNIQAKVLIASQMLWMTGGFCSAQDYRFDKYSLQHGLSQVSIVTLLQDSKGFIWIGTLDGLNRFDGINFKVFNHDPNNPETLSDPQINAVLEDKRGRFWVGTKTGGLNYLNPANGKVKRFLYNDHNNQTLNGNNVLYLSLTSSNLLWVITDAGGINLLDPEQGVIRRFYHEKTGEHSLSHNRVNVAFVSRDGTSWVGTHMGLNRFRGYQEGFTRYINNGSARQRNRINAIVEDRKGILWLGTGGGIYAFDPVAETFQGFSTDDGMAHNFVTNLFVDRSDRIWAGGVAGHLHRVTRSRDGSYKLDAYPVDGENPRTRIINIVEDRYGSIWASWALNGLMRFDEQHNRFNNLRHQPGKPVGLPTDVVNPIMVDRSGALWVGTGAQGLLKYDLKQQNFAYFSPSPDGNGLRSGVVRAFEEKDGALWVGTQFEGVSRLDREKGTYQHFQHDPNDPNSLDNNNVRTMHLDSQGRLWVGGPTGGLNQIHDDGRFTRYDRPIANIMDITDAEPGALWIGTLNGLYHFNPDIPRHRILRHDIHNPKSLPHDSITSLFKDRKGRLWVTTNGGGFALLDEPNQQFTSWQKAQNLSQGPASDAINCIYQDSKGRFWLGTWGGGLNLFDEESQRFKAFTLASHGLPNNVVYGVLEGNQGELWCSSNKGVFRFDPEREEVRAYDMADGLQSNEFNQGAWFKTARGEILFGGINGFNMFHPSDIQDNPTPPPLVITSLQSSERLLAVDITKPSRFVLPHQENRLFIEFVALDYTDPKKNRYRYRMSGVDDDWIDAGARRHADYTNLNPGSYRFTVLGANRDGVWNKQGTSVEIVIQPPYWQTKGFYFLEFLAALGFMALLFNLWRLRQKHLRRTASQAMEHERRRDELELARTIQLSMLPGTRANHETLDIEGRMRTASEVGGDYYDFIPLEGNTYCVAWGDATGHGIAAGMIAGMTKAALINSVIGPRPDGASAVLQRLNLTLKESIPQRGVGMGMGLALFNLEDMSVEVCSAGMPFSYHYRPDEDRLTVLELKCPPLGFLKELPLSSRDLTLKPGDVLVFLSDGIAERVNPLGHMWGVPTCTRELHKILQRENQAGKIADALLSCNDRFAAGRENPDDMTVVVVRV